MSVIHTLSLFSLHKDPQLLIFKIAQEFHEKLQKKSCL